MGQHKPVLLKPSWIRTRPGTRLLGTATLPCGKFVEVVHLTGTASDLAFLRAGLAHLDEMDALGRGFIPAGVAGIGDPRHEQIARETLEMSLAALKAHLGGDSRQAPVVLAVLTREGLLLGLRLGHIERRLPDGQRCYTPLPWQLDRLTCDNHSTLDWISKYTQHKGVGVLLTAVNEQLLCSSVQRIDTVAAIAAPHGKPASVLQAIGMTGLPALLDARHIPSRLRFRIPPPDTFREMGCLPMTVDRATYRQRSHEILTALDFREAPAGRSLPLDRLTRFAAYERHSPVLARQSA